MSDHHAGRVYEVTGPRALTFGEAVAETAAATGRPIRYRQISPEEFSADMRRAGVPEEVLGRPARDFADYARKTAATGVWRV